MPRVTITIVPKEIGEMWDFILESTLNDICKPPVQIPPRSITDTIAHKYYSRYNVHHGVSYQQYTPNLCGYHSIYNTLCFLNILQGGYTHYDILSGASFWSFKKKVQKFLMEIKRHNKLKDEWPWRQQDILFGDFQRTYNKLCLEYFEDFEIFRDHDHFELLSFTWQFQYQNLLLTQDKKRELNKYITYFKSYSGEKPLIISFMLAITNHWMCFLAIKSQGQTQYWFFDSSNRNFLDLTPEEIDQYVQNLNEERKRWKKEGYSDFFKQNMGVCMKDTQISIKLIIDCLQGRTTLEEYAYNQQFNIFASQLQKHWDNDEAMTSITIKDYWHNISSFFRTPVQQHLFTKENNEKLQKLVRVSHELRLRSEQGKKLNQLVKKYSHQTHI